MKMTRGEAGRLGALHTIKILKQRKEESIASYLQAPIKCKKCGNVIPYERRWNTFCSHGCSASFHCKGKRHPGKNPWKKPCKECGKETTNKTWCSHTCHKRSVYKLYIREWLEGKNVKHPYNRVSQYVRRYLLEMYGNVCSICNGSVWMGYPMPLLVDHKNGNPTDNSPENVRLVCGNCDMQLPTFKGRNAGNGRAYRRERYKLGKSY